MLSFCNTKFVIFINKHIHWTLEAKMDATSHGFQAECQKYGLDPNNTSMHDVECAKLGLPIGNTSMHDVEQEKIKRGIPLR